MMEETIEQYAERIKKRDEDDLRSILKLPHGRRFIAKVINRANIFHSAVVESDVTSTIYNNGMQDYAKIILRECMAIDKEILRDITEQHRRDTHERNTIERIDTANKLRDTGGADAASIWRTSDRYRNRFDR